MKTRLLYFYQNFKIFKFYWFWFLLFLLVLNNFSRSVYAQNYCVVKTDKNGNKQWDKTSGGSGYDELKKVNQLASGEYVLGGYSNSPTAGKKSQNIQG